MADVIDITEEAQKKTPEELAKEALEARQARYIANPDMFLEISDIIAAAIRTPGTGIGISIYVAPAKRSEYDAAFTELNLRLLTTLMGMDKEQWLKQQENKNRIVKPNHPSIRDIFKKH